MATTITSASTPAQAAYARHRRRTTAGLLLVALLIPGLGGGIWWQRHRIAGEYHYHKLSHALHAKSYDEAKTHLFALLERPDSVCRPILERFRHNSALNRQWLSEQLVHFHPTVYRGIRNLGRSVLVQKPPRRRDWMLEMSLALDTENLEALTMKAERALLERDFTLCVSLSRKVLQQEKKQGHTPNSRTRLRLGIALFRMDSYANAEIYLQKALTAYRNKGEQRNPLRWLVLAQQYQEKHRDAIETATRLLHLAPSEERPALLAQRGKLFGLLGRHDLALQDLAAARAREADPRKQRYIDSETARTLAHLHRPDEALTLYDSLLASDPHDSSVLEQKAWVLEENGKSGAMIRAYRKALLNDANNPPILNGLAWALLTAKDKTTRDPVEALRLARRAVKIDGENTPAYLDTLAEACYMTGHYAEAVQYETLALQRGGEMYGPSLTRFRAAAEASRNGRPVTRTDSTLIDKTLPPRGDGGADYDPSQLPPLLRLDKDRAMACLRRSASSGRRTLDQLANALALLWKNTPPAVGDNPQKDFFRLFLHLHAFAPHVRSIRNSNGYIFLEGVFPFAMRAFPKEYRQPPGEIEEPFISYDDVNHKWRSQNEVLRFGRRFGRWALSFTPKESAHFLTALTEGRFRLAECFSSSYYPGLETLAPEKRRAEQWKQIETRLRLILSGKPFPAKTPHIRIPPPEPEDITEEVP